MLYTNDYLISSNNSINDNKYNTEKMTKSTSYKLKKMLKPLLRLLKNNTNNKKVDSFGDSASSQCSYTDDCCWSEVDDNAANEELEAKLFNEINNCMDDAAIYVYKDTSCEIQPVFANQSYVPVHFARTEAGMFFWTTVNRAADSDLIQPKFCSSDYQEPQLQYGDRWVQA